MRLGKQNTSTKVNLEQVTTIFWFKKISSPQNGPFVRVDFSPQPIQADIQKISKNYPTFNRDRHCCTPAFVLQEDKMKIIQNFQSYLNLHLERVRESAEQKEDIFVPKPSKANSYCSICKQSIDDYLTHLSTLSHQQRLKSSPFREDINQLCTRFSSKKKKICRTKRRQTASSRKQKSGRDEMTECSSNLAFICIGDSLDKAIEGY